MTSRVDRPAFAAAWEEERARIEARLEALLDELARGPATIEDAVRYMVLDAGKRLRPVLCLWTHDAFAGTKRDACLDAACAIECLHTYSLIHDDLPCMDDDDLRRGRPSCHKKYGEAVAVLAGDALLTLCFDILASAGERWAVEDPVLISVTRVVSRAAGTRGLIGGQVLDITSDTIGPTVERVEAIHQMKTAALIAASMEVGALMAGVNEKDRDRIRRVGLRAGEAFQIIDDVLDLEEGSGMLGKTPGKDLRDGKLTYPSVVGVDASRERARELIEGAMKGLGEASDAGRLSALLAFMVERRA